MKTAQDKVNAAIQSAAAAAELDVGPVTFTPSAGNGGNRFATIAIGWTVGPAWGELRIEFKPLRPYEPAIGLWRRGNGVAVTPAGFPMLPALSLALRNVADAAATAADIELPAGLPLRATA